MDIDTLDDWPYNPTEEQMIRQHAHLVSEENRLLRDEVSRYRQHLAKIIDMHGTAYEERDKLVAKLRAADGRISDLLRAACDSWSEIDTLKRVIDQHRLLLRSANVSPELWGERQPGNAQPHTDAHQSLLTVQS
ncbi:hypothetical protein V2K16_24290 [Pseudomonas alliivorans]|uniref:hypothetical protein n=1 Tax=Pseudomonas alliivorans TaxID=2810613 RepID=UPI001AE1B9AA|nr:hypothetical protein [Pseudomonas alliivorans]MBP0943298.1 hypothetical protein [Pseudomonas alliivorans]MEE4881478.1 hypothetical protein [Pseudomonas alliivorans]MEE4932799.1 hypothetical protein [Pseudomonas alliivorans]MEE4938163.1 hypothetical protein [Pseudomonas alliivorans]MEE4943418.1 hypothetical protein [Pseudomonas alliivorans]